MLKFTFAIIIMLILFGCIPRILTNNQADKKNPLLGIHKNGYLAACPDKPNCVSSETHTKSLPQSHINAISYPIEFNDSAMSIAEEILIDMGAHIITSDAKYIGATFCSKIFAFVDDFELRLQSSDHLLQFRSASRLGYSDFGVNKKRVLLFKQRLKQKLNSL